MRPTRLARLSRLPAALALAAMALAGPPAAAQTAAQTAPQTAAPQACGAPDAPCQIEGGFYHAAIPPGAGPFPTVMFLHGYGGRAARSIAARRVVEPFLKRGYAVIAPQGEPRRPGDKGGSWNTVAHFGVGRRDDVAFLLRVAEDAAARFGLDRRRMIASGFSGGGMMVWNLACKAPRAFAAFAPVAGLFWLPLPETCEGPVRMLHTHGWSDPVVPIEGRSVAGGRITQGNLFDGLALMRRTNRCATDAPGEYAARGDFLLRRWTACAPGSALEFAMHPQGHKVPAGWSDLVLDWYEGLPGES